MRLKEQRLWDRMRKHLGDKLHMERIENSAGVGIPDVLCLAQGIVTFAELKAVLKYPARATTRVLGDEGLNQKQKNWHHEWGRAGGRSVIVVGVMLDIYCLWGNHADHVNDYTHAQLRSFSFAQDWVGLQIALSGSFCAPDGTCLCAKFGDNPAACKNRRGEER